MKHRHYGQMGRGEATECYLIKAWESTDNHRSTVPSFDSPTPINSFPTSSLPFRSYASILSRLSRHKSERKGPAPSFVSTAFKSRVEFFSFLPVSHFSRFGWFWQCPSGESCQYRHALPPGFVLKSQKKAMEEAEKANTISLEEFLEVEVRYNLYKNNLTIIQDHYVQRHKLGSNLTPVTRETFAKWKKTRMNKKEAEADVLRKTKDAQAAAGKNSGMSGRDLFQYNPEWFQDSDEEDGDGDDWDLSKYRRQKEDEDIAAESERIRLLSL